MGHPQGPIRVGIEAAGPIHWFVRLLGELGHELWIGDSAKIRASEVRKHKTDERDALLILDLLLRGLRIKVKTRTLEKPKGAAPRSRTSHGSYPDDTHSLCSMPHPPNGSRSGKERDLMRRGQSIRIASRNFREADAP